MDKLIIKRLSDDCKCNTATEFMMKRDVITTSAIDIISKINEIIEWIEKHDRPVDDILNGKVKTVIKTYKKDLGLY